MNSYKVYVYRIWINYFNGNIFFIKLLLFHYILWINVRHYSESNYVLNNIISFLIGIENGKKNPII